MPRGPKINFMNNLTPSAVVKLSAFAKEYGDQEGMVLSRVVEWLSKQDEEVQRAAVSAPTRTYSRSIGSSAPSSNQLQN